jgi:hypothetical protein
MKVGDIIPIDIPDKVIALVDDVPLMECRYGQQGGQYALKIDRFMAADNEETPARRKQWLRKPTISEIPQRDAAGRRRLGCGDGRTGAGGSRTGRDAQAANIFPSFDEPATSLADERTRHDPGHSRSRSPSNSGAPRSPSRTCCNWHTARSSNSTRWPANR